MSAYLAKLKQLESEKYSHYVPDSEPSKPSKVPFEPFEGTGTGHIEKKNIGNPNEKIFQKNALKVNPQNPQKPRR